MVTSKFRGHKIYGQGERWYYVDNNEPVATTTMRPCGHCNRESTPEGHDACIRHLPGVMNACCGHGNLEEAYIQLTDGSIIQGLTGSELMQTYQKIVDALERGDCVVKKTWSGDWLWLWHEVTSTGYTQWCRFGFGSRASTVDVLIYKIILNPEEWVIISLDNHP